MTDFLKAGKKFEAGVENINSQVGSILAKLRENTELWMKIMFKVNMGPFKMWRKLQAGKYMKRETRWYFKKKRDSKVYTHTDKTKIF